LKNDQGLIFSRGARVAVSREEYSQLQNGPANESFLFIAPKDAVTNEGGLDQNRVRVAVENKGQLHLSGDAGSIGSAGENKNSGCC
jgi:hypothetical protein